MVDYVVLPGIGQSIAAEDVNGVMHIGTKIQYGVSGVATDVSSTNPLPTTAGLATPLGNLFQALTVNGDGTGDSSIDTDFSSVADDYYIQPSASEVFRISVVSIAMMIPGTDSISLVGYGGSDTVLTNGIKVIHSVNSVETLIVNFKSNLALISLGLPVSGTGGKGGTAAEYLTCRIIFPEPVRLDGAAATPDQLIIRVNDDHTQFSGNVHIAFVLGAVE